MVGKLHQVEPLLSQCTINTQEVEPLVKSMPRSTGNIYILHTGVTTFSFVFFFEVNIQYVNVTFMEYSFEIDNINNCQE